MACQADLAENEHVAWIAYCTESAQLISGVREAGVWAIMSYIIIYDPRPFLPAFSHDKRNKGMSMVRIGLVLW